VRFYLLLICTISLLLGESSHSEAKKIWVFFKDKQIQSQLDLQRIAESLDQKTIVRRKKVLGENVVTEYDIPVSKGYLQNIKTTGAQIEKVSRWLNAVSILGTDAQIDTILKFPFVKKIKSVPSFRRQKVNPQPNQNIAGNRSIQTLDYGNAQAQMEQIGCDLAHDAGFTGEGVRILVMDTGFSLDHAVFDSLNLIDEWDFVNDDEITANETVHEDTIYQHNHGTMVLSAMAGYAPGYLIGPAFDSEFLLAKTEKVDEEIQIEEDNYVAGLEWGETNGADIVSTSLGYLDWYTYEDMNGDSAVTTIAVDIAVALGMVCVTAAGNEGNNTWNYIIAPADADSVISVGAVSSNGTIASFSSHGPTYDGRIKPEVCARGVATACASPAGKGYTAASGTSLAAPLVGGSAALILSAHPTWNPMMVREALIQTASQHSSPDNNYGYGIINVWDAINYSSFESVDAEIFPVAYSLSEGFPNPFNSGISFSISLLTPGNLSVTIFDIEGKVVEVLFDGDLFKGDNSFTWAPKSQPAGVYFVTVSDRINSTTRKITYLK
jgi:serine protease AprX